MNKMKKEQLRMNDSKFMQNTIELNTCKKYDLLISSHQSLLFYMQPLSPDEYYDHEVMYLDNNLGNGSRTNDGYVFRNVRKPEIDHDIIRIIRRDDKGLQELKELVLEHEPYAKLRSTTNKFIIRKKEPKQLLRNLTPTYYRSEFDAWAYALHFIYEKQKSELNKLT